MLGLWTTSFLGILVEVDLIHAVLLFLGICSLLFVVVPLVIAWFASSKFGLFRVVKNGWRTASHETLLIAVVDSRKCGNMGFFFHHSVL